MTLLLNQQPITLSDARRAVCSSFPADIADNAALVLSELVGNAVLHALPGDVRVLARADRFGARVVVVDPGASGLPDEREEHGFGLGLVEELSDRTGAWLDPTGRYVAWAAWDLS